MEEPAFFVLKVVALRQGQATALLCVQQSEASAGGLSAQVAAKQKRGMYFFWCFCKAPESCALQLHGPECRRTVITTRISHHMTSTRFSQRRNKVQKQRYEEASCRAALTFLVTASESVVPNRFSVKNTGTQTHTTAKHDTAMKQVEGDVSPLGVHTTHCKNSCHCETSQPVHSIAALHFERGER
jgi:hypothetical protein